MNGKTSDSIAGELAADFMFLPTGKHHLAGLLNQLSTTALPADTSQFIGMSTALLIGIR
jgi:hypothetical protein